jgi:hypothetical protein
MNTMRLVCLVVALAAGCSHAYVQRHPSLACWDKSDPRSVPPMCVGGRQCGDAGMECCPENSDGKRLCGPGLSCKASSEDAQLWTCER